MGGSEFSTDFLYARPSFFEGAARVLDFTGTLTEYNQSITPDQADAIALRMDWAMVGQDLKNAMDQFAADHAEELAGGKAR